MSRRFRAGSSVPSAEECRDPRSCHPNMRENNRARDRCVINTSDATTASRNTIARLCTPRYFNFAMAPARIRELIGVHRQRNRHPCCRTAAFVSTWGLSFNLEPSDTVYENFSDNGATRFNALLEWRNRLEVRKICASLRCRFKISIPLPREKRDRNFKRADLSARLSLIGDEKGIERVIEVRTSLLLPLYPSNRIKKGHG